MALLAYYKPLYNTSMLSEVLELALLEKLSPHLSRFEFFSSFQSAYRSNHSFEIALCRIYIDLVVEKASENCVLLMRLDLSAVFDTVDVELLLQDLQMLGISGRVYEWLATYLRGRQLKVLIRETYSSAGHMNTGVPQERIIGPLLFLIYTACQQYLLKALDVRFHFKYT